MGWHVVQEFCDHGCNQVVLVKSVADARVFAYCPMCEAAWAGPGELERAQYVLVSDLSPSGVLNPSSEEVEASGWAPHVLGTVAEDQYLNLDTMNWYLVHLVPESVWRLKGCLPAEERRRRETALIFLGIGAGLLLARGLSALLARVGMGDWVTILLGVVIVLVNSWLVSRPPVTSGASSIGNPSSKSN